MLSALERLLREGSDDDVRRFFVLLRPPELADLLEHTGEEDRLRVLRLMGAPLTSEVLREVDEPEKQEILDALSPKEIAKIVEASKSDDAADLIGSLSPDKAEDTLERLDREERAEIEELLRYPEESSGGLMQTEVVRVRSDLTVKAAVEAMQDDTLAFRRSCREGVCGSDAMNINAGTGWPALPRWPSCRSTSRCGRCPGCP